MNNPDDDDSLATAIEDKLVELSVLAETQRIPHAEAILDPPEDVQPDLGPAEAWAWMWDNDRPEYHRAMDLAITTCPEHLIDALLHANTR